MQLLCHCQKNVINQGVKRISGHFAEEQLSFWSLFAASVDQAAVWCHFGGFRLPPAAMHARFQRFVVIKIKISPAKLGVGYFFP